MRVFARLLSALIGLVVAGAGVLLALEVGWAWWRPVRGPLFVPWTGWRDRLAELTWDTAGVRLAAIGVAVAGLLLILVAVAVRRRVKRRADPENEDSDRPSRKGWVLTLVVGLAALLGGVAMLVVGAGWLGRDRGHRSLLDPIAIGWLGENLFAARIGGLVLGLLLLALGLWWFFHSARPEEQPAFELDTAAPQQVH